MGTKNNPGPFDCYAKAHPDEPIFTLRAKDPLAPALVRLWAHVRRVYDQAHGRPMTTSDSDKYFEANQCADQMELWLAKYEFSGKRLSKMESSEICHVCGGPAHSPQLQTPAQRGETLCVCGHMKNEHNILQDYAGPGLPAHPPQYRHCKECACPVFQRPNM